MSRNPDWWNRFGKVVEKYKRSIHKKHPILHEIHVTPAGNIFVPLRATKPDGPLFYWLLDPAGKTLAQVTIRARRVQVSRSYIFFALVDEDYNSSIYAWPRTGTEKDDLLQLQNYLK